MVYLQLIVTLFCSKSHIYQGLTTYSLGINYLIGPLHDAVTWYPKYYTGMQITQCMCELQNKGTRTTPARLSFVLKVPLLRCLRSSMIYSVPCDRIVQSAYLRGLLQISESPQVVLSWLAVR